MAKPTTKRRPTQVRSDEIPDSIFDALNASAPGAGDAGGEPTEQPAQQDGQGGTRKPTVEDLYQEVRELKRQVEESERANMALTSAVSTTTPLKEPKLVLDNLPDPVTDPKAYGVELAMRMAKYNDELRVFYGAQQQVAQQSSANADVLWEDFSIHYAPYVEDEEGVKFAVDKVLARAKARGIDINRYMYANSDRFFRDIAATYDERFGPPEMDNSPPQEAETAPRRRNTRRGSAAEGEDNPGRTGGIFGGQDLGGNRAPREPPAGDMIKDLRDIQRKTGYY